MQAKNSTFVARFQAIPAETIEAVRALSPIEQVISVHVRLRRSGAQLVGRCPFHSDKTPSFSVSPAKQVFHCHGCHAGGDVFQFVRPSLQCGFRDSVAHLAARAGMSLDAPVSEAVSNRVLEIESKRKKAQKWKLLVDGRRYGINIELATKAENFLREYLFGTMKHIVAKDQISDLAWSVLAEYREIEAAFTVEIKAFEDFKADQEELRVDAA